MLSYPIHERGRWQQAANAALVLSSPDMYAREASEAHQDTDVVRDHLILAWQAIDLWRCSWPGLLPP